MNNRELRELIEKDGCLRSKGVRIMCKSNFKKLDLTKITTLPHYFILNTEDCLSKSVGHWFVVVLVNLLEPAEIFDSLAMESNVRFTYDSLNKVFDYCRLNNVQVQAIDSELCGLFCMYFLRRRCRGMEMDKIIETFNSEDLKLNDTLVYKDSVM